MAKGIEEIINKQTQEGFLQKLKRKLSHKALTYGLAFSFLSPFARIAAADTMHYKTHNLFIDSQNIDSADTNKLFLTLKNVNFFKNNEYFNPIVRGYTLIGYWVRPELAYYPSSKSKFSVGMHLLKYSGNDQFYNILPTLSFRQSLTKNIDLIIGTLEGSLNHKMSDLLYAPERYFTNNVENGLQFLINSEHYKGDVWLNWEHFIFEGDSSQERLSTGTSSVCSIFEKDNPFSIDIPFQTFIAHKGGQINTIRKADTHIETLFNGFSGIRMIFKPSDGLLQKIEVELPVTLFANLSPTKLTQYKNGWGILPSLNLQLKDFYLSTGLWYGKRYMSPRGERIYQSVSFKNSNAAEKTRSLSISRIAYSTKLKHGIDLAVAFEGYYDIKNKIFDYSYGLQLNFRQSFLLKAF